MAEDLAPTGLNVPKNYLGHFVFNLQLAGVSIHDIKHPIFKYFYNFYFYFMMSVFIYFLTIAEFLHMCETNNLEDFLFTASYCAAHVVGCSKIAVFVLKRKAINKFLQSLEQGRFLPNLERGGVQEFVLIKQAISKSILQSRIWWTIVFIMLSNRLVWIALHPTQQMISLENPNETITVRQFPYATSYLISFDMQKSPWYELIFIQQFVGVWIFGWYMGNADFITNGIIIHLTAQFKIVANAFACINKNAEKLTFKDKNNEMQRTKKVKEVVKTFGKNNKVEIDKIETYKEEFLENFKKCLRDCIQHHQDTLNLTKEMENTFHMALLVQCMGVLIIYSMQLYQLSLLSLNSTAFISMIFFFCGQLTQLLAFCWNGNEMSLASEAIAEEVYKIDWVPADKTVKDLILQVIMRAQKPVYLTAGKFTTISMQTFATILRASASYYTVLINLNEDNVE